MLPRVLIVDDELMIGRTLRRALGRKFDVVNAESGLAAQALIGAGERFDLVLCDLMMPDVTGMDLYDWTAQQHAELAGRMIFMTGGTYTKRARDFLENTGVLHLEKPFELTQLHSMLELVLQAA